MSSPSDLTFSARHRAIRDRLDRALERCGRSADSVRIIGVAKRQDPDVIRLALEAGLCDIGENFVQEWDAKRQRFEGSGVRWHFIGALQRNKVKQLVGDVALIHSVDRLSLLHEIDKRATKRGCVQSVLLQVSVAGERAKAGVAPSELNALYEAALSLDSVDVRGLMIFPPAAKDPEETRTWFRQGRRLLTQLQERCKAGARPPTELSMGMSHDFEVAVEEGATLVRVGSALFGPRTQRG